MLGAVHEDVYVCDNISLHSSYNEKFCNKTCRENQNTYFILTPFFLFFTKFIPFVR
jgi:hypothetical protein